MGERREEFECPTTPPILSPPRTMSLSPCFLPSEDEEAVDGFDLRVDDRLIWLRFEGSTRRRLGNGFEVGAERVGESRFGG